MNVSYVKVDGKDIPVKWNQRSKSNWEELTGLLWSDLFGHINKDGTWRKEPIQPSTKQSMVLCHEILREGHRIEKKPFKTTLDDVFDMASEYDLEAQITDLIFGKGEDEKKVETVQDLSEFSLAFSYGISYSDYLIMSPDELNQAILGGQYRESRENKLPRMIAYMMGRYLEAIDKREQITDFYPLPFDQKKKVEETKEAWERARRIWDRMDKQKSKL